MKLNIIIMMCATFMTIVANAQQQKPISYNNEYFLWYENKRMYWPDGSTTHTTCWNDHYYFATPSQDYKNNDCKIMLNYINAVQKSVYIEGKKKEYQEKISKNKAELEKVKASQANNKNIPDQSMINEQQALKIKDLSQSIQKDENKLAALPKTIPINFPTDGEQKDKDAFENAITNLFTNLLPSDAEDRLKEIAIIEAMLNRARNEKLYDKPRYK